VGMISTMEWSNRSFLLDIKPNGCFANLFVNCPEGEHRDLIRILKDGVELAPNSGGSESEDILEHIIEPKPAASGRHQSLKATVDGLLLCPDTVTNYAWTDDHQTFSCKLKVERWEECYFSPKSLKATLKILSGDTTLDQLCQQFNGNEIDIQCVHCRKRLLKESAKLTRIFQLPSSNYSETADEWFCCCAHHREHHLDSSHASSDASQTSCSHAAASSSTRMGAPNLEQCFIGDSHFLLNGKVVEGVAILLDNANNRVPVVICAGCQSQLGTVEVPRGAINISDNDTIRFYHSAVDLQKKTGDSQRSFLSARFRTRERYFAWLLLSECEQQSSLKFALKTLDNHPALLVWLLDSYSIMVNGRLSDLWNSAPFKPFPILKMLYKKLDDSDRSDPRVTGEDGSVGRLSLPKEICDELTNFLGTSTISLPPACRAVGHFSVGYVRMASSL